MRPRSPKKESAYADHSTKKLRPCFSAGAEFFLSRVMNQSERNHITPEFILSKTFKTNCRLPNSKGCDLSLSAFLVDLDVIAVHPKTDCLTFWACDFGKNTSTAFFDGIK